MSYFVVFAGTFLLDVMWTLYVRGAAAGHPQRAGLASIGITLCSGMVTLEYIQDHTLLVPAALGAYGGTLLPIYLSRRAATRATREPEGGDRSPEERRRDLRVL